jgi:PncC family amidohydrolase
MKKNDALNNIANVLTARTETLAIAESVTAGLLMATFSLAQNATAFFQGGITAYNLGQKCRQLSVDPIIAEKVNSVSETISQQMAKGVADNFCSDWGIGITGYAVPVPELDIKTCFAYCAIAYHGDILFSGRLDIDQTDQYKSQEEFVLQTLEIFRNVIS